MKCNIQIRNDIDADLKDLQRLFHEAGWQGKAGDESRLETMIEVFGNYLNG